MSKGRHLDFLFLKTIQTVVRASWGLRNGYDYYHLHFIHQEQRDRDVSHLPKHPHRRQAEPGLKSMPFLENSFLPPDPNLDFSRAAPDISIQGSTVGSRADV